ncbi:MAG: hypothetical protein M1459_02915 [Patescibacteria group bacterium]|nr:hypothetical protein [Patescibacteria group bacterium]
MSDINFNDPINWRSLGFFSVEDYLIFVFKKIEKITAALYLVSGLLKDEEPIKWELRDKGMNMLSSSFNASSTVPGGDKNYIIQSLFTSALETMSLLNVARISNLISDMNHNILVKEIDQVLGLLRDRLSENANNAGLVLSEQFFKTPSLYSSGFKDIPDKRRSADDYKETKRARGLSDVDNGHLSNAEKRLTRQEMIVSVLKGNANLSIKDFAKVIKDCSEKTIQRELTDLVNRGLIKKEGERRWSRYSLN